MAANWWIVLAAKARLSIEIPSIITKVEAYKVY